MKNFLKWLLIFMSLTLISRLPLLAQFQVLETNDLRLIYFDNANTFILPHLGRCFENTLGFYRRLFHYSPTEKITVLLQDFGDYGNAAALTIPTNLISVGIAPYSYAYETSPANERMNMIMNHELVHIVTLDQAARSDRFFRSLFWGKVRPEVDDPLTMLYGYLTNPRWYSPRWYREGIAVFLETWMAGGLGRAMGGFDEMVFRTLIAEQNEPYSLVGLESAATKLNFQVGVTAYLYGTRFMSYLALRYSPQKVLQWVSRPDGSKAYFARQFQKVFGLPLHQAWANWLEWEKAFQQSNLDSLRKFPLTPYRPLLRLALGSISNAFYHAQEGKLYLAVNYPGEAAHILGVDIARGKTHKFALIKDPALYFVTSLAYDSAGATIFFTTDNNGWRDLRAVDLRSGKSRLLLKDVRLGDLAFNSIDRSLWGVRHYNGISTLTRVVSPYREWDQIYSWPYGKDLYDIAISPDGRYLVGSLAELTGRQTLILMSLDSLLAGNHSYQTLFDFENSIPMNFVFSPDGKYLYGSSYYTGVSNIYRYDLAARDMSVISNCLTGLFRPVPYSADSLIAFRFTRQGFQPVMIPNRIVPRLKAVRYLGQEVVEKHPVVTTWTAGSPRSINLDSLVTFQGNYRAIRNVQMTSLYPVVEGYKNFAAYGLRMNLSDPLLIHQFNLLAAYTPNRVLPADERFHGSFRYRFWGWTFKATYNNTDFYDLFGPTKTSRRGYALGVDYHKTLLYDPPRNMDYRLFVSYHGNLETLPEYQNIAASYNRLFRFGGQFQYQNFSASLGAVDYERGVKTELVNYNNYVNGRFYPRFYANLHLGTPFPIRHSSGWMRASLGWAPGKKAEPFANFYFGGFGNNWVDHLTEKRYREFYSFPGVAINAVGGTNFARLLLEWNLPPLIFRRLGRPDFFCSWARTSLFTTGLVTNLEAPDWRRKLVNFGGQIDFKWILFYHLKFTLSLGYAVAWEKNQPWQDEFMVSLKIL